MKPFLTYLIFLSPFLSFVQAQNISIVTKKIAVKDTIKLDSISINPLNFQLKTKNNVLIDTNAYNVDYPNAFLLLKQPPQEDSIIASYQRYPPFLTKVYKQLDPSIIVNPNTRLKRFYSIKKTTAKTQLLPFDGLNTSGSISRGISIGNNQNAVLNSELDLQISGKLSDKVSLRASIQDANIPLQDNGYSQRLDEFDQVFIELFSKDWNIRAGDVDLTNTNSYFANFTKRVQGLMANVNLSKTANVFAAGALVRGQFTTTKFVAQEGNQGPYKLRGPNGELFVLVVSGSETVYVNGLPLQRGENRDYIIDYNAGEITFNATFPITSEMRITVDYQFSERNYTRFTIFGGSSYNTDNLKLHATVYSESDAKNQPLQQNLSTEQTQILANAGDDNTAMLAPSAVAASFSENRILYRKEIINGEEIFVVSNNPEDELFSVRFTLVGENQGNYVVSNANAINTIFEYIPPIGGELQGNYAPILQLVAPERLQIAMLNGHYQPTKKTNLFFELAGSKNDLNLFSSLDDTNNNGFAAKLKVQQHLVHSDSLWNVKTVFDTDIIQDNFRTIQRLYRAEFNRDWNLLDTASDAQGNINLGNQVLLNSGLQLSHPKKGNAAYNFEYLDYANNFNGKRHRITANLNLGAFHLFSNSSYMSSGSNSNASTFLRSFNRFIYTKKKAWMGTKIGIEANKQRLKASDSLTPLSQRFTAVEVFAGIGDSTKVYAEVGYVKRYNDSLRNNQITRVNSSDTYYLKSRWLQNKTTTLQWFINFRHLKYEDTNIADEQSLNSRFSLSQKFLNNSILWNTSYETNSGSIPQQDFTYVAVEAGQGTYTWNDYNGNGVQELDEFEIAQFTDEASFIRVLLPNQRFERTEQNRLSTALTLNPKDWKTSKTRWKRALSHFHNQSTLLTESRKLSRQNQFNFNPFEALQTDNAAEDVVNLSYAIRNVLFYNRGQQNHTTSYTFVTSKNRNLLSVGILQSSLRSHQINYNHKFWTNWLFNHLISFDANKSFSDNFNNRNFEIGAISFQPKLSYLFNENAQFDLFFQYTQKDNQIQNLERLLQQNYGLSFVYNNAEKVALTGEFNFFQNRYRGNANSPIGYEILQGLQPGQNFTWSLVAQKKITKFLDLNLNYFGRKTQTSRTIHSGTVQLRAFF